MLFVTVGAQMPFDRLVRAVDAWAEARDRDDVVAQIGPSELQPRRLRAERFLEPAAFQRQLEKADAVIGHAGMGTIISALQLGKPLLVLPRRADLQETRNDHQLPTARHFAETGRLLAAFDEDELWEGLDRIEGFHPAGSIGRQASPELLARLRRFLDEVRA